MKRIVLFRFHGSLDICANRLQLLHRYNPGIRIIGLWGGDHAGCEEARHALASHLEYVWEIPVESPHWKWQHGDLSLLMWHRCEGRHIPFEVLHLVEWDLLILSGLDRVYGQAGRLGVAVTGLTPLERVPERWHWTTVEPCATQWLQIKEHVRKRYGWEGPYFACQGPANVFSKAFLDSYAQEEIPELVNDELRIPLYASLLGFEVEGLPRIYPEIQDSEWMKCFNCEGLVIKKRRIRKELIKPWGKRVFHPYREPFQVEGFRWPF